LLDAEHTTVLGWFFGLIVGPLLVVAGVAWLIGVGASSSKAVRIGGPGFSFPNGLHVEVVGTGFVRGTINI
jgi:hypothetical protein